MSIPKMNDPPDPILEEIHATRRRLLEEHGGISGLAAFLREEQAKTTWPIAERNDDEGTDKAAGRTGNEPAK